MKEYFYISGLPRSGNTLLSTILNENLNIHATGHSFVTDLFFAIKNAEYNSDRFKSYPCHNNLNNVYKNIIPNYYKDHNIKYIIRCYPISSLNNIFNIMIFIIIWNYVFIIIV